ncbi:hypothetical protein Ancab_000624 [Ancistrocladus abbreviatus]
MDTGSKFYFEPNLLASTPLGSPFMMLRPQSESPFETQHQINMNQEEDEKEDKDDNEEGETVIVTVGKKWKDYKCNLKALYFDENKELDEQLVSVPPNVDADQWATLVSYWRLVGKGCKTIERLSE